jgi:hypothetical protein
MLRQRVAARFSGMSRCYLLENRTEKVMVNEMRQQRSKSSSLALRIAPAISQRLAFCPERLR